jgi:hypothetical protein
MDLAEAVRRVPKGDFTHNDLFMQVDAAFKWHRTWSEFKELPQEDRVIMIAYLRAINQMGAIEANEARS